MKKSLLLTGLLLAGGRAGSAGEGSKLPERIGNWQLQSCTESSAPSGLGTEAGQLSSSSCTFKFGPDSLSVSLTRFSDPSGAYEVYTSLLTPEMQPSTVGGPSAIGAEEFLGLIGDHLLLLRPPAKTNRAELDQLVKFVSHSADRTPLPPIRAYLPPRFTDGTQRYALGPKAFLAALDWFHSSRFEGFAKVLGFDSGAEAMLAGYREGRESGVVLLVDYPTPQLAEQHLKHLEMILEELEKPVQTRVERRGSLLTVVLDPTSAGYADRLRAGVRYQTSVTWHEPTQTITDPPWTTILGKIITLTLLFMVMAVVLGVAFGGLRVVLKRLFPGKVFDRPNQMDVLQLGLSGKRIDSEDFY